MQRSPHNKYKVHLTPSGLQKTQQIIRRGVNAARVIIRANILLAAHAGEQDEAICQRTGVSRSTVHAVRKHYCEDGITRALYDLPRPGKPRKLNGKQEATVIAIACSKAPKGYDHWTMDLLTEEVQRQVGVKIGRTAIWKITLRSKTKPWRKKMWCILKLTGEYIRKMNDVLEVYERPYDRKRPVVCLDEKPKQLLKEIRAPWEAEPGKPKRVDYEYERCGTANIVVAVEPKGAHREVRVTPSRSMKEFAMFITYLADKVYKTAEKIILIVDNLNIHNEGSLVEILGEKEGKRIAGKIEWHWTPKHASWLNQAEIENHSLQVQCLARRIPDSKTLKSEVAACVTRRNKQKRGINWQFTREKAKAKFHL